MKIHIKNNLRIKPFLTAFGRNKTAEIMKRDLKYVIRVHTDECLEEKQDFSNLEWAPVAEEKTSGSIIWYSTNSNNRNFI
jgi:hypothetical protein